MLLCISRVTVIFVCVLGAPILDGRGGVFCAHAYHAVRVGRKAGATAAPMSVCITTPESKISLFFGNAGYL